MERESFICYKSFIDAGKQLPPEDRLKFYDRMLNYAIYWVDEITTGFAETLFILVRPNLDANNKRYEDWCRWWRPKKTTGYWNKKPVGGTKWKPNEEEEEEEEVEEEVKEKVRWNNYSDVFEKFWIIYPIKKWKAEAYTAWKKCIQNTDPKIILQWAQDYATRCRTTGTDKIKRAQGWLNARRWEDEISTPGTDKQKLLEERRAKKAKQEEMAKKTFIWWLLDDETDTI